MLTGELVPVDWHGLPVQVLNGPDRSSEVLIRLTYCPHFAYYHSVSEFLKVDNAVKVLFLFLVILILI